MPQIWRSCSAATPGWAARCARTARRVDAFGNGVESKADAHFSANPRCRSTMTTETTRLIAGSSQQPPVRPIDEPGDDDTRGHQRVGRHMHKRALMLRSRPRPEAKSSAVPPLTAIPMAATPAMTVAVDRHRLGKAPQRLPGDAAGDDEQDHGVGEGGEDRTRLQPIGEPAARAAPARASPRPRTAPARARRSNYARHRRAMRANAANTPATRPRPRHRRGSGRCRSRRRGQSRAVTMPGVPCAAGCEWAW